MKRFISFVLLCCVLLGALLPISAYAAPAVDGSDGNTSRFYNKQSNTGLDAYPGSAKVDGVWDENDEWDNALPLTLNEITQSLIADCGISSVYDGDFYLLWDENGLYIMEVQREWSSAVAYATAKGGEARPWNAWATQIFVSPNQEFVQNTSMVRGLFVFETSTDENGNSVAFFTPVKAVVTQRDLKYTSWPGAVSGSYVTPESIEGVTSYFSKTSNNGYVMETFMSWEYLGMTAPDANTSADIVDALGVKLGMGKTGGTHLGNLEGGSEGTGLDPVTLRATPNTVKKTVHPEKIDVAAAEAYWTDAAKGQFIVNADAAEYEISTAEQLLGLSLAMENNENDKAWTQGKTFKLTKDIDLNPGVDWTLYKKQQLDPLGNVCEHYIALQAPVNEWKSFDHFYGTFDGQGHTISGIWALNGPGGTGSNGAADWGVFAGVAYKGTQVKNVILDNGYVSANNNQVFGGIVGLYRHLLGTNDKNDTSTIDDGILLENIYIGEGFTVNASAVPSSKQAGGIIGSGWHGGGSTPGADHKLDVTLRNIVFGGSFIGSEACSNDGVIQGYNRQTTAGSGSTYYYYNTSMINCVVTGTYSNVNEATAFNATNKANNFIEPTEITDDMKGEWIETEKGILPVVTADMLTRYAYQATSVHNGSYSIRIIGEVASIEYDSVDFKITLTRASDGKSAVWGYGSNGYVNSQAAYNSVIANGMHITADALNSGFVGGTDNKLYVLTLNDLDANETYTISVSTVWTLQDGTVIEGGAVKCVTPEPFIEVDGVNLANGYNVVISQTATDAVKQSANSLIDTIADNTGIQLDRVTDNTEKNPVTEKEIILSISDRQESKTALAALSTTGYSISFSGEKLVVVATNDFMLEKAVDDLISRMSYPNYRAMVDEDLSVTYDGSGDMFSLVDSNNNFKYRIVYPDANANYEKEMAQMLASSIQSLLGCKTVNTSSDFWSWIYTSNVLSLGKTSYSEVSAFYNDMGLTDMRWAVNGNKFLIGSDISSSLDETLIEFYSAMSEVVKGTYDGKYMLPNDYDVRIKTYDWMENIPEMAAGSYIGVDDVGDESAVFVWQNVNESDYEAYLSVLKDSGFAEKQSNSLGDNRYMLLEGNITNAYVSYVPSKGTIRLFVENRAKGTMYPSAVQAQYTTVDGYVPKLWQLEIDWKTALEWDTSLPEEWRGSNGGMCYIMQVADGSFVIIDSGMNTEKQANIIYEHLKANTTDEKPVISAWIISHMHADHTGGFQKFTKLYKDQVIVKAFYFNIPAEGFGQTDGSTGDKTLINSMKQYSGAEIYRKLHTGMSFYVADARFDVMYTHEDLYPVLSEDFNETSTVIRVTFGGQRIMFLADVQDEGGQVMIDTMPKSEMKSDIVQYAHHGWDGPTAELYDLIEAPTILWPISIYSWQYEAEGENIFHRLITETTWAYFYEVNNYIAYYAEYVKTIIINAEGTGTQELILPYTPRAERLPDYVAIYEAIKAREEGTGGDDIGGGDTPIQPEDFTVVDDDRNDFGPISGSD